MSWCEIESYIAGAVTTQTNDMHKFIEHHVKNPELKYRACRNTDDLFSKVCNSCIWWHTEAMHIPKYPVQDYHFEFDHSYVFFALVQWNYTTLYTTQQFTVHLSCSPTYRISSKQSDPCIKLFVLYDTRRKTDVSNFNRVEISLRKCSEKYSL